MNLYKINLCYISFIIHDHHWKLCALHLYFFCWNTLNYFLCYLYLYLYIEVLDDSNFFKCLITIKISESWFQTLQIFFTLLFFRNMVLFDYHFIISFIFDSYQKFDIQSYLLRFYISSGKYNIFQRIDKNKEKIDFIRFFKYLHK